jgi:ubiquinone biosynthesis protein
MIHRPGVMAVLLLGAVGLSPLLGYGSLIAAMVLVLRVLVVIFRRD